MHAMRIDGAACLVVLDSMLEYLSRPWPICDKCRGNKVSVFIKISHTHHPFLAAFPAFFAALAAALASLAAFFRAFSSAMRKVSWMSKSVEATVATYSYKQGKKISTV